MIEEETALMQTPWKRQRNGTKKATKEMELISAF